MSAQYAIAVFRDGERLEQGAARIRAWEWRDELADAVDDLQKIAVVKADERGSRSDEWLTLAEEVAGGATRFHDGDVTSYVIVVRRDGKVMGVLA